MVMFDDESYGKRSRRSHLIRDSVAIISPNLVINIQNPEWRKGLQHPWHEYRFFFISFLGGCSYFPSQKTLGTPLWSSLSIEWWWGTFRNNWKSQKKRVEERERQNGFPNVFLMSFLSFLLLLLPFLLLIIILLVIIATGIDVFQSTVSILFSLSIMMISILHIVLLLFHLSNHPFIPHTSHYTILTIYSISSQREKTTTWEVPKRDDDSQEEIPQDWMSDRKIPILFSF